MKFSQNKILKWFDVGNLQEGIDKIGWSFWFIMNPENHDSFSCRFLECLSEEDMTCRDMECKGKCGKERHIHPTPDEAPTSIYNIIHFFGKNFSVLERFNIICIFGLDRGKNKNREIEYLQSRGIKTVITMSDYYYSVLFEK